MSFTYGADAEPIINTLRDEIDDTQVKPGGVYPDGRNFSDQRLLELYTDEGVHLGRFIARCCEILARAYAHHPTSMRLGPEGEEYNAFGYYTAEASRLRRLHGYLHSRKPTTQAIPTEVKP
jgi:hypothetical protein